MNIIETAAPIAIDYLKQYFTEKTTFFVVQYKDSQLKGAKLLTYLSNLNLPCDINMSGCSSEEAYELMFEYLHFRNIVNINSLEQAIINILYQHKGLTKEKYDAEFIDKNIDVIKQWESKLDSLTIYNMYTLSNKEFKQFSENFENDDTDDLTGINFVSLLKHPDLYLIYNNIDKDNLKFYTKYFNDYMFGGKSLYSYWAVEENPLFILTFGIASGEISGEDYVNALKETADLIAEELK